MCRLLLSFLFVSGWIIPVTAAELPAAELFSTIRQRLDLMQSIALYKAQNQIPIENVDREIIVIADAKRAAAREGLDADSIEEFFVAQIAVAKAIQYRYRAELLSDSTRLPAIDLDTEIRPEITELGGRIVILLARYLRSANTLDPALREPFNQALTTRFVSPADKTMVFDALLKARLN
jgi:chorismate mutase